MIFLCQLVHHDALLLCPANFQLRITIDLVSEKSIVNTFEMFTLSFRSFAASLPRIPGYKVLFLFFSFTVSSTVATPFLDHVVRDRESIQSLFIELSAGFAFNQELSASAVDNSLIANREDIENIALSELFRTTRITLHCPIHGSSPSNCC